jgi:hypothetical protein
LPPKSRKTSSVEKEEEIKEPMMGIDYFDDVEVFQP